MPMMPGRPAGFKKSASVPATGQAIQFPVSDRGIIPTSVLCQGAASFSIFVAVRNTATGIPATPTDDAILLYAGDGFLLNGNPGAQGYLWVWGDGGTTTNALFNFYG